MNLNNTMANENTFLTTENIIYQNPTSIDVKDIINGFFGLRNNLSAIREFDIKNVIFNDPATIVFWADGTKTVVRCAEEDTFDKRIGLAMAICKKVLGTNASKSNFNDVFKKWCEDE